jgi:hypothetical protein
MAKIIGDGAARVGVTDDGMVSLEASKSLTPDEVRSLAVELNRAANVIQRRALTMTDPTDAELDAATDAYVCQRWPNAEEWRERFPEAWRETRIKMRAALIAAATVREHG